MTIENLEQEIKKGNLNSIYLFYGEEEYLLENCVKKIKKQFRCLIQGINYIQIDETNVNNLISDIQTPAFGYDKKLIIVKNSGLFKTTSKVNKKSHENLSDKINEYIKENIKTINKSVIIIFIEKEINKTEIQKTIENIGVVCKFDLLKPAQIFARIKAICNAYKVNIDEKTMQLFIETCGTNMQNLINEIRKLIEYVGENGKITEEEINKLSIKEFDSVIFDLTDNLGNKNINNAIQIMKELIYNKEPVQKILITLYNHFKKIYITILANKYNKNIAESLNLKPNQMFLVSKYKRQAGYFKEKELRKILQELIDLDYNYKQGLIDINIGLEAILCTYCS